MKHLKKYNESIFSFFNRDESWAKNILYKINGFGEDDIDYKHNDFYIGYIKTYFFFIDGKKYSIKRIKNDVVKYELYCDKFELKCSNKIKMNIYNVVRRIKGDI